MYYRNAYVGWNSGDWRFRKAYCESHTELEGNMVEINTYVYIGGFCCLIGRR